MNKEQRDAGVNALKAQLKGTGKPDLVVESRIHGLTGCTYAPGERPPGIGGIPFNVEDRIMGTRLRANGEGVDQSKRPPSGKANGFHVRFGVGASGRETYDLIVDGGTAG